MGCKQDRIINLEIEVKRLQKVHEQDVIDFGKRIQDEKRKMEKVKLGVFQLASFFLGTDDVNQPLIKAALDALQVKEEVKVEPIRVDYTRSIMLPIDVLILVKTGLGKHILRDGEEITLQAEIFRGVEWELVPKECIGGRWTSVIYPMRQPE